VGKSIIVSSEAQIKNGRNAHKYKKQPDTKIQPNGQIIKRPNYTTRTDGPKAKMVPGTGIEPVRHLWRGILSPLCLPISPSGRSRQPIILEARAGVEPTYTDLQSGA
jgi:hypothetical protein